MPFRVQPATLIRRLPSYSTLEGLNLSCSAGILLPKSCDAQRDRALQDRGSHDKRRDESNRALPSVGVKIMQITISTGLPSQ